MSRPIRGTQDLRNRGVPTRVAGPAVKITCPKCRAPAYPGPGAGTGNKPASYICTGCGRTFSTTKM